jgi:DNA-binding transcriptional ArsR family regulator
MVISPMWELVASWRLLTTRKKTDHWATALLPDHRARTTSLRLRILPALMTGSVSPHFLTPPAGRDVRPFEQELSDIAALSSEVIATELGWAFGDVRRWQDPFQTSPAVVHRLFAETSAIDELAAEICRYWREILAPVWSQIEDHLLAERERKGQVLTAVALQQLSPAYRYGDDRLFVANTHLGAVEVDPHEGVSVVVSAFSTSRTFSLVCPRLDIAWAGRTPMLPYVARRAAHAEVKPRSGQRVLASVVGTGRATVLAALDRPRSTTELAALLDMSPAGVSRQLAVLFNAGLAERQRLGYSVRYRLTPSGQRLLGIFGLQAEPAPGDV